MFNAKTPTRTQDSLQQCPRISTICPHLSPAVYCETNRLLVGVFSIS